ncbi:BREX-1 system adenine-specific DNA-methyltransferase PglX [Shewanella algae]|uniref:site-specific DNA-methyltransferase (adenine-specific) n=2 Tax=Unclassified Bacteria TaxID=49928 RepID=A0AAU6VMY2_UNCXX|nr:MULTISPECIES: BREX-1 system adenine-specific DNA-methyltransferase PglX [Shewanella]MCT8982652.1 BREX-1 system adenine-specific DNA-methyltransferase PglX [Shewanella algae]MDE0568979.1 BREX-1 system adenine-specific DNA-methyltransferase PglX [Shewanella sp. K8]
MRQALDKTLRSHLEKAVVNARELTEIAASEALSRLGVSQAEAPSYLKDDERALRNRLRAHARQLGDKLYSNGKQDIAHLSAEMAYEHWHRMLFARFLEQNQLLMYDAYTAVTLTECQELAADEGCKDGWQLAGLLAQRMLPQIFQSDSPVLALPLAIDRVRELEDLILTLPTAVFEAQDSLGWCYQFWQSKRKDEVNAAGVPIGADELSPVTQLFTEPYMVSFLLDNSLGAWWAKKRLTDADLRSASDEATLRRAAAIDGVPLEYLRFVKTEDGQGELWQAAGGWFEAWPEDIAALKTLDPCCGSGHFLVALLLMLVPMRMALEGIDANTAIDRVLKQNLHGLELDSRCVEIAAFALALEAWRYPNAGGYRSLPALNLACSGLDVSALGSEWQALAKQRPEISDALSWFARTFKDAPVLGSLIDVNTASLYNEKHQGKSEGEPAPWQVLLDAQAGMQNLGDEAQTAQVTAQGLAMAAKLLADKYTLVATNVPYLARGKQCDTLKDFCENYYPEAKPDLATVFLERCLDFSPKGGSSTIVLPQNWLFLTSYKKFREKLLTQDTWNLVARLGPRAFETISGEVVQAILITLSKGAAAQGALLHGLDVSAPKTAADKAEQLLIEPLKSVEQAKQLENPDARVVVNQSTSSDFLTKFANGVHGFGSKDSPRYFQQIWEQFGPNNDWQLMSTTVDKCQMFAGRQQLVFWQQGKGILAELAKKGLAIPAGEMAWGKKGVAVSQMGALPATIHTGEIFDKNVAIVLPKSEQHLPAIWAYCSSPEYNREIRQIDQSLKVTNTTLVKVPFDLGFWQKVAEEKYSNGLPKPYSNDPTQWIFHGHPCGSVVWDEDKKWTAVAEKRTDDTVLQVAVARLLGYRWPAELDDKMELADEMLTWLSKCDELLKLQDDDGIVCLPAIRGEKAAANRLEAMLQAAYEEDWSAKVLTNLLASVGSKSLETWLRDKFFEQHCKLFQHRPFIWQIWDGLSDGFSVLVNYHKLDYKGLERLIYTYLGEWIRTQEHGVKEGIDGADSRLMAAKNLKDTLEAILKGEAISGKSGLDIFVRWKPLHEQPIGWHPDLNDGVRLNIRPFMQAPDIGKKGAGILRAKPNINWNKDRGTDVASAPWYHLGPEYGEKEGARINDHHLSLAEKQAARDAVKGK